MAIQVQTLYNDGGGVIPVSRRAFYSFSYGGRDIEEFNLVAVFSDKGLEKNLYATFEDVTKNYIGLDGQQYYLSNFNANTITFNLATDGILEKELSDFTTWFKPGETKKLILSEHSNRYAMARVSEAPTLELTPFEEKISVKRNGSTYDTYTTIYKGSITISFILDDPYWYAINKKAKYEEKTKSYDKAVFDWALSDDPSATLYGPHQCSVTISEFDKDKKDPDDMYLGNKEYNLKYERRYNMVPPQTADRKVNFNQTFETVLTKKDCGENDVTIAIYGYNVSRTPVSDNPTKVKIIIDGKDNFSDIIRLDYVSNPPFGWQDPRTTIKAKDFNKDIRIIVSLDTTIEIVAKGDYSVELRLGIGINSIKGLKSYIEDDIPFEFQTLDDILTADSGHVMGDFFGDGFGVLKPDALCYVYNCGTAHTYPIINFEIPITKDETGFINSIGNRYGQRAFDTIKIGDVAMDFTLPNLFSSYNESLAILSNYSDGDSIEDLLTQIREDIVNYQMRAKVIEVITKDSYNENGAIKNTTGMRQEIINIITNDTATIKINCKEGYATLDYSLGDVEINQQCTDMLLSRFLYIPSKKIIYDDNGNIDFEQSCNKLTTTVNLANFSLDYNYRYL